MADKKQEIRDKINAFSHKNYDSKTKSFNPNSDDAKKARDARKPKDKMAKAIDAEIEKQGGNTRGTYGENAGGGTPGTGKRGGMHSDKKSSNKESRDFIVADSPEDPIAIQAKEQGIPVRYSQPRDEDGQFTYNSANNRKLSTNYSRGHTLPPFLQGVYLTFIKKGSEFQYTDENGKLVRVISSIDMTPEELANTCKKYLETEGGFAAIVGTAITKHGRPSNAAKSIPEGKIKDLDVTTLAQSTQDNLNRVSQNKDGQWIADQTAVSDIIKQDKLTTTNPAYAYKLAQEGPNATPPVKKPTTPATPKVPVTTVKGGDIDNYTVEKIKSDQIFAKNFVRNNKSTFDKIQQKNPKATPDKILKLIADGKIKNLNSLLED